MVSCTLMFIVKSRRTLQVLPDFYCQRSAPKNRKIFFIQFFLLIKYLIDKNTRISGLMLVGNSHKTIIINHVYNLIFISSEESSEKQGETYLPIIKTIFTLSNILHNYQLIAYLLSTSLDYFCYRHVVVGIVIERRLQNIENVNTENDNFFYLGISSKKNSYITSMKVDFN